MAKKRNKLDIVQDILLTIRSKGGKIRQTHLMYKANLSHTQMKGYLAELKKNQLISEVQQEHNTFVLITDQGFKFLERTENLTTFEQAFGL